MKEEGVSWCISPLFIITAREAYKSLAFPEHNISRIVITNTKTSTHPLATQLNLKSFHLSTFGTTTCPPAHLPFSPYKSPTLHLLNCLMTNMSGPSFSRGRCIHKGCAWNHRSDGKNLRNHIIVQHQGAKPLGCGIIPQSHDGWMPNHLAVCKSCRNSNDAVRQSIEESAEIETVQSSSDGANRETGRSASVDSMASSASGTSGTEGNSINNSFNNITVRGSLSVTFNVR
ncbi:hypothetical protein CMUS01_00012 [Colletotrichum musicola]|uniref:Uncharacterized protein n=1 Tax=Colletotrichum musicola TaxID=2175873 RepID=A0A8H6NZJ7_9PEZI|nr:hypothetical protein CMUS01_00012 [Colletotrichum musicola]